MFSDCNFALNVLDIQGKTGDAFAYYCIPNNEVTWTPNLEYSKFGHMNIFFWYVFSTLHTLFEVVETLEMTNMRKGN